MFTVPVGNFKRASVGYRPTANVVTAAGTAYVSNPAYAYDSDPSTNAEMGASNPDSSQVIYSGFSSVVSSGATLNINILSYAGNSLLPIDKTLSIWLSYDGGLNYLFKIPDLTYTQGALYWSNPDRNIVYSIPDGVNFASLKIKFLVNAPSISGYAFIYDIVINQ